MTNAALRGKPDAGNPHVRFDEGEVASAATPRRGSLLYKTRTSQNGIAGIMSRLLHNIKSAALALATLALAAPPVWERTPPACNGRTESAGT